MAEGGRGVRTVQYLCEFFFGNFWHFCALILFLYCVIPRIEIRRVKKTDCKEDGDGDDTHK